MRKEIEIAPWINREDTYPVIPDWVNEKKKKSRRPDKDDGAIEGIMWGVLALIACAAIG